MGYIMDLRALVGRRPLIQVGSSVILEDAQGRVLLQLRSDDHCWDCSAAGSMEPGESAQDTARRELLEETGLTAHRLELTQGLSGPDQHYVYPNGDEVYNVDFVFFCRDWSGTPQCQPGEVEQPLGPAAPQPVRPHAHVAGGLGRPPWQTGKKHWNRRMTLWRKSCFAV